MLGKITIIFTQQEISVEFRIVHFSKDSQYLIVPKVGEKTSIFGGERTSSRISVGEILKYVKWLNSNSDAANCL